MFDMTVFYSSILNIMSRIQTFYQSVNFTLFDTQYNLFDVLLSFTAIELIILPLFDNEDDEL